MESAKTGRRSWELTKKAAADVRGGRRSCKDAYTTAKNLADGNCALWAVFFFALLDGGMDAQSAEEVLFMKGAKPVARKAMTDFLILCRQCIVDYTRLSGKMFYSAKGRAKTEEEVNELLCSSGEITCHSEWELTILLVNGYFDVSGVCVLGELMGLPDTQVVQEYATGLVNVLSAESPPPKSNLVMHRGKHFEALVPKESMQKPSATSGPPRDLIWVVEYLTELLKMNFDALVARDGIAPNMPAPQSPVPANHTPAVPRAKAKNRWRKKRKKAPCSADVPSKSSTPEAPEEPEAPEAPVPAHATVMPVVQANQTWAVTKAPEVIQIPSKDSSDEIRKETVAEAKAPTVHPRIVPGAKQKSRRRNKEKSKPPKEAATDASAIRTPAAPKVVSRSASEVVVRDTSLELSPMIPAVKPASMSFSAAVLFMAHVALVALLKWVLAQRLSQMDFSTAFWPRFRKQDKSAPTKAAPVSTMYLQRASTGFAVTTPPASRRCRVVRGRRYRPLRGKREKSRTTVWTWPASVLDMELVSTTPQTVATAPKMGTRCKHPRLRAAALGSRFRSRGIRLGSIRGGANDGDQHFDVDNYLGNATLEDIIFAPLLEDGEGGAFSSTGSEVAALPLNEGDVRAVQLEWNDCDVRARPMDEDELFFGEPGNVFNTIPDTLPVASSDAGQHAQNDPPAVGAQDEGAAFTLEAAPREVRRAEGVYHAADVNDPLPTSEAESGGRRAPSVEGQMTPIPTDGTAHETGPAPSPTVEEAPPSTPAAAAPDDPRLALTDPTKQVMELMNAIDLDGTNADAFLHEVLPEPGDTKPFRELLADIEKTRKFQQNPLKDIPFGTNKLYVVTSPPQAAKTGVSIGLFANMCIEQGLPAVFFTQNKNIDLERFIKSIKKYNKYSEMCADAVGCQRPPRINAFTNNYGGKFEDALDHWKRYKSEIPVFLAIQNHANIKTVNNIMKKIDERIGTFPVPGDTCGRVRIKAFLFFDEADLIQKGESTTWATKLTEPFDDDNFQEQSLLDAAASVGFATATLHALLLTNLETKDRNVIFKKLPLSTNYHGFGDGVEERPLGFNEITRVELTEDQKKKNESIRQVFYDDIGKSKDPIAALVYTSYRNESERDGRVQGAASAAKALWSIADNVTKAGGLEKKNGGSGEETRFTPWTERELRYIWRFCTISWSSEQVDVLVPKDGDMHTAMKSMTFFEQVDLDKKYKKQKREKRKGPGKGRRKRGNKQSGGQLGGEIVQTECGGQIIRYSYNKKDDKEIMSYPRFVTAMVRKMKTIDDCDKTDRPAASDRATEEPGSPFFKSILFGTEMVNRGTPICAMNHERHLDWMLAIMTDSTFEHMIQVIGRICCIQRVTQNPVEKRLYAPRKTHEKHMEALQSRQYCIAAFERIEAGSKTPMQEIEAYHEKAKTDSGFAAQLSDETRKFAESTATRPQIQSVARKRVIRADEEKNKRARMS